MIAKWPAAQIHTPQLILPASTAWTFNWTSPQSDNHNSCKIVNHRLLPTNMQVIAQNAPFAGTSQKKILRRSCFIVLCTVIDNDVIATEMSECPQRWQMEYRQQWLLCSNYDQAKEEGDNHQVLAKLQEKHLYQSGHY